MNRNAIEPLIIFVVPLCFKLTCLSDAPMTKPTSIKTNDITMIRTLNVRLANSNNTNKIAITFSIPHTL